jgi:hypothetical protein
MRRSTPRVLGSKPENRRSVHSRVTAPAVELLLFAGCRPSQVLNLQWDRADFDVCPRVGVAN